MARSNLDIILRVVDKASGELKGLTSALSKTALAFGAVKAAGEAWDLAKQGAALKKAENAYKSMAKSVGQDMDAIASAIVNATDEAVDMQTAMEAASRAIKLGVATTPEEFARLAEASTKLGAAMGRGPVDALNDVVTGIGRMSPLILDNIGIVTSGGKVFEDYAQSIGKTAKELSDAEKKQALLNQAIQDGSKLSDANATGFEQLDAAMADFGNIIKKDLVPAIEPLAKAMAEFVRTQVDAHEAQEKLLYAVEQGILTDEEALRLAELRRMGMLDSNEALRILDEAYARNAATMSIVNAEHDDLIARLGKVKTSIEDIPEEPKVHIDWDDGGALAGVQAILRNLQRIQNIAEGGIRAAELGVAIQEGTTSLPGSPYVLPSDIGGPGYAGGANFVVPPGFPGDSFPFRASSGERVIIQPAGGDKSYFSGSTVNINNGTSMDAFEAMLRGLQ